MQHVLDGKQVNCLSSIQMLMKLCNHPSLIADEDTRNGGPAVAKQKRAAASRVTSYADEDDKPTTAAPGADGISKYLPYAPSGGGGRRGDFAPVFPEWSGKMFVLFKLMKEMRKPGNGNDKIVIVSNYTQTLDLIGRMCRENSWGFCRLDGSINMKKRQKMVDEFNDPTSPLVAFLLSSKAGGCGLNLIGGNRLVLFDPDWNPAVDKQAAARCWRDGQKKRCFTYRFLATGTVEEKIFQRQLSKEGLQSVVDDKEQVNALSTKDLRNLFKLRTGTPSDTHDKLRCERCKIIHDDHEMEAKLVLPKKLKACKGLLEDLVKEEDAKYFLKPIDATEHGKTKEEYEQLVKQPMDFETIRKKLELPSSENASSAYSSVSGFSKDVNRIFSNVAKVWDDEEIAIASRRLQASWIDKWGALVPVLMVMKSGGDGDSDEKKKEDAECTTGETPEDAAENLKLSQCAQLHNERGDDYQEQIGMPDEENMRAWQHHHSTDTVDDPIFRAAMRGCDAVSFVFGLEVTWSLIQERQQEEDEKLALECMNQVDDSSGSDQDDSDDDDDAENQKPNNNSNAVTSKEEDTDSGTKSGKVPAADCPKPGHSESTSSGEADTVEEQEEEEEVEEEESVTTTCPGPKEVVSPKKDTSDVESDEEMEEEDDTEEEVSVTSTSPGPKEVVSSRNDTGDVESDEEMEEEEEEDELSPVAPANSKVKNAAASSLKKKKMLSILDDSSESESSEDEDGDAKMATGEADNADNQQKGPTTRTYSSSSSSDDDEPPKKSVLDDSASDEDEGLLYRRTPVFAAAKKENNQSVGIFDDDSGDDEVGGTNSDGSNKKQKTLSKESELTPMATTTNTASRTSGTTTATSASSVPSTTSSCTTETVAYDNDNDNGRGRGHATPLQLTDVAPAGAADAAPPKGMWSCPACTFHNGNRKRKCEACGTSKTKKRSLDEASGDATMKAHA